MKSFGGSSLCPHDLSAVSVRNGIRRLRTEDERATHVSQCVRCGAMIATIQESLVDDPLVWLEQD